LLGSGVGTRSNEAGSRRHKVAAQAPLYGAGPIRGTARGLNAHPTL
jgi:hypothetical protein